MNKIVKDLQQEIKKIKKLSEKKQDVPFEKLSYLLLASLMEEEENVCKKIRTS